MRKCPHCSEQVQDDAKVCKHCSRDIPPKTEAEKQQESEATMRGCGILLVIVLVVVLGTCALISAGERASDRRSAEAARADSVALAEQREEERAMLAESSMPAREMVGQCAFNRSDGRPIGRVTRVGKRGEVTTGSSQLIQRMVTVRHTAALRQALGEATGQYTHPRNIYIAPCG